MASDKNTEEVTCTVKPEEVNETKNDKKKGMFSNKKVQELEERIKELEEKDLRNKAEFANYKKRREEEVSRMLKFANEDLLKELLPILDNIERAVNMDDDNLDDDVSKFLEGFKMIYCNIIQIFKNHGVTEIETNGKDFDPNIHQAMMTEVKEGVEPGKVIEVLQKGYLLKDKVLRPAMVKVSE